MIILGLGSNLGDTEANLKQAIKLLEQKLITNIKESKIYTFPPLLPKDAPKEWDIDYSNMVIAGELKKKTDPEEVLRIIKEIENKLGRKQSERWAPREIDIDILAWDNLVYESPTLQIPHKGLTSRAFALIPLSEIAPDWVHPVTALSAHHYARQHIL